jgi:hypothetical protein
VSVSGATAPFANDLRDGSPTIRRRIERKRIVRFITLLLAVIAASFTTHLARAQDVLAPGFREASARPVGAGDSYATLADGTRLRFNGQDIWLEQDDGTLITIILTLPASVFPGAIGVSPSGTLALVGESTNGQIYKVDLLALSAAPLLSLSFNYDISFESDSSAIVSAAACGTGLNCLYRVDLASGASTQIASVGVFSGPVEVASNGDVYYCTSRPEPNASLLLRWTNAQVHSGAVLTEADAFIFPAVLAGGSSLAIDPVYGHIFLAESPFTGSNKLKEFNPAGATVNEVLVTSLTLGGLELLRVPGNGSFQAFQPDGVRLRYRATNFGTFASEIVELAAVRPVLTTSGPGLVGPGDVTISVNGAFPSSTVLLLSGQVATYNPQESAYDMVLFLFHTGMPLGQIRRTGIHVPLDANGNGSYTYFNPGTLQGTRVLQGWVRDDQGRYVGSTTAAFN